MYLSHFYCFLLVRLDTNICESKVLILLEFMIIALILLDDIYIELTIALHTFFYDFFYSIKFISNLWNLIR